MNESGQAQAFEPGTVVHGRYRVDALLARMVTGILYEATDELTEDRVDLQVVDPALMTDKDRVKAFLRAGAQMRGLRHENHVVVYDVNLSGEGHYLSMEHLDGVSLTCWETEPGELHGGIACRVVEEILKALESAHEARVVHGGLRPDCVVMLTTPEETMVQLKVRDFGLASAVLSAEGATEADDLRAAANLLAGLLSDKNSPDTGASSLSHLPAEIVAVLETALGKEGYANAAAFRVDLEAACAAALPLPAVAPGGLERGWTEDCHVYSEETLIRYGNLLDSRSWDRPKAPWNPQGMLAAHHAPSGLDFVLIPEGEFEMGCDEGYHDERPAHDVTVGAFLLCTVPCPQNAYDRVGGEDFREDQGERLPITFVSHEMCKAWGEKVGLRLPSEAEWEYACRAGTDTHWCFGDEVEKLPEYAWFKENSEGDLHSIGRLAPSPWGLFDVHGLVWEWCEDAKHDTYEEAPDNARPWTAGEEEMWRVIRGGSIYIEPAFCRSSTREWKPFRRRLRTVGFRPAADLP